MDTDFSAFSRNSNIWVKAYTSMEKRDLLVWTASFQLTKEAAIVINKAYKLFQLQATRQLVSVRMFGFCKIHRLRNYFWSDNNTIINNTGPLTALKSYITNQS